MPSWHDGIHCGTGFEAGARFHSGRPIRLWQPRREGERNEVLNATVNAMADLRGRIRTGLQLDKEAKALSASPPRGAASAPDGSADPRKAIRSRSIG